MLFVGPSLKGVSNAVASLVNWSPVVTAFQSAHDWFLVLSATFLAENP